MVDPPRPLHPPGGPLPSVVSGRRERPCPGVSSPRPAGAVHPPRPWRLPALLGPMELAPQQRAPAMESPILSRAAARRGADTRGIPPVVHRAGCPGPLDGSKAVGGRAGGGLAPPPLPAFACHGCEGDWHGVVSAAGAPQRPLVAGRHHPRTIQQPRRPQAGSGGQRETKTGLGSPTSSAESGIAPVGCVCPMIENGPAGCFSVARLVCRRAPLRAQRRGWVPSRRRQACGSPGTTQGPCCTPTTPSQKPFGCAHAACRAWRRGIGGSVWRRTPAAVHAPTAG